MQTKRFRALDGWRGICAVIVASYHFPALGPVLQLPIIRSGWMFVDFFFVLSGFVIYHRYLSDVGQINLRQFFVARLKRLYPLHIATMVIAICLSLLVAVIRYLSSKVFRIDGYHDGEFFVVLASHIFMIQGFHVFADVGFNVPSWSISVEFWANLLFAVAAVLVGLSPLQLCFVSVASTVFLATMDQVSYVAGGEVMNALRAVQGFGLGALACQLLGPLRPLAASAPRVLGMIEIACIVALLVFVPPGGRLSMTWLEPWLFAICVLVYSMEIGCISRFLAANSCVQLVGSASYAIYLVHPLWVSAFYVIATAMRRLSGSTFQASNFPYDASEMALYIIFLFCVIVSSLMFTRVFDGGGFISVGGFRFGMRQGRNV